MFRPKSGRAWKTMGNSATTPSQPERFTLPPGHVLVRIQRPALVIGVVGLALSAIGIGLDARQFFQSYLVAYLFWLGITLGSLPILMLQYITGGAWGAVLRRILESATRTLPLLLIFFVPLLFGLTSLYEWARPEAVAHDPMLQHKQRYLNLPFFLMRAAVYFAIWLVVMWFLNRWSAVQDDDGDPAVARRLEYLSRGGLLLYALTMTFASIDWVMSLEPHWFSTIYGILFIGGQVLAAFAFAIPVAALIADRPPLSDVIGAEQFHDLGKLLLAFIMLWAYFAFSQFLIIWSGNLPEETPWYLNRLRGGWEWIGIALIALHFALPFAVLLSRDMKRNARRLALVACGVIVMRAIDLFWLVSPAFESEGLRVHWLDLTTFVGVGGIWLTVFIWQLRARPLLPLHDPSLELAVSEGT
jgi:hypothetical protein